MLRLLLPFAVFVATTGQSLECPFVFQLDCTHYPIDHVCGTDLVSYENQCDFAKSQCNNKNLHIIGTGSCVELGFVAPNVTPDPGPTTTHTPVFLGHNVVRDFFCLELMHEHCRDDTEKVCGTDNRTYQNFCEFEKARCTHSDLNVKHYGRCT